MAFTAAQKKDIRKYLGCAFGFYDLNTRLESGMVRIGEDATDSAEVAGWLTRLAEIDVALTGPTATSTATYGALKKVDEIEFHAPTDGGSTTESTLGLVSQGRVLIMRLARAFGVDDYLPNGDYFSGRVSNGGALALG